MGRAAAAAGHARLLTGYGLELALETPRSFRFIDEICALVPRLPLRGLTLRHWRGRRFEGWPVRRAASLLSPGFEPPFESFYHLVVCLLKSEGLVADAGDFYPSALRELARASASHASEEKGTEGLAERCRRIHFETYFLSRLMGGKAAACREAGAVQSSPALSLNGPHAAQAGEGARLQREAFAREVPAEVSARLKSGSIISAHWSRRLTAALAIPAQEAAERLSNDGSTRGCLLKSYGRQLAALGLWRRIFDAGKIPVEAPSLSSIGLGGLAGR
jgi:hypothetical protein